MMRRKWRLTFTIMVFFVCAMFLTFLLQTNSYPLKAEPLNSTNNSLNGSEFVSNLSLILKLTPEVLMPPDHLGGLRMERDGHLNPSFRKEVIIGKQDITFDSEEDLLTRTFHKADEDKDGLLNKDELENWIASKVKEHFAQAVKENFLIFTSLDKNHDGRISWDEYHVNFMLEKGFSEEFAKQHADHKQLDRKTKEKILLDKASWSEAANSDPGALNIDEFLTFRHPEHSHVSLLNMVNDIISTLDVNGDEHLSAKEFADMPPDDNSPLTPAEWKAERLKEFSEVIDTNGDGKVSRQELLMYNDPENPLLARKEARELVRQADMDKDGFLSLKEILHKKDIFLGSKMVDTARSFHDEF